MKKIVLAVITVSVLLFSCGEPQEAKEKTTAQVEVIMNEVAQIGDNTDYIASIEIDGMTCAMGCAKTIENKLKSMDGVTSATVDFEKTIASVGFDNNIVSADNFIAEIAAIHDGQYVVKSASVSKPVKIEGEVSTTIEETESAESNETVKEQIGFSYPSIKIPTIIDALMKLMPY
jgi:mercuric ion binding protein